MQLKGRCRLLAEELSKAVHCYLSGQYQVFIDFKLSIVFQMVSVFLPAHFHFVQLELSLYLALYESGIREGTNPTEALFTNTPLSSSTAIPLPKGLSIIMPTGLFAKL